MKKISFTILIWSLCTIAKAQESFHISLNAYVRTDMYRVTDNGNDIKSVSKGATMVGVTIGKKFDRLSIETGLYKTSYNSMSVPFRTIVNSDSRLIIEKQFVLPLMIKYDLIRFAYRPQRQITFSLSGGFNLTYQNSAKYPGLTGIPSNMYILTASRDTVISARSKFYYESKYIILPAIGASLSIPLKRRIAVLLHANYTFKNIASAKPIVRAQTTYNLGKSSPNYHATIINNGQAYNFGIGISYFLD
jgi:hypothetical protein